MTVAPPENPVFIEIDGGVVIATHLVPDQTLVEVILAAQASVIQVVQPANYVDLVAGLRGAPGPTGPPGPPGRDPSLAVTALSRPGTATTAPQDFACGDQDASTSITSTASAGYGRAYADAAANTSGYPLTGSEILPEGVGVAEGQQQLFITYTSDYPVVFFIDDTYLDNTLSASYGAASDPVTVSFAPPRNLAWADLSGLGGAGAPVGYAPTVYEWWIETNIAGAVGPTGPEGPEGPTGPQGPASMQIMTQAAYDALPVKDPAIVYVTT